MSTPICPVCKQEYVFPNKGNFYTFNSELGDWLNAAPAEHLIQHQLEEIAQRQSAKEPSHE